MKKSSAGFVLGLIGSIICLGWGFYSGVIGEIADSISTAFDGEFPVPLLSPLGWLCFFGSIAGIVGASLCIKRAKIGAIVLTFATLACLPVIIYCFLKVVEIGILKSTMLVLCIIPVGLMISAVITAFCGKEIKQDLPKDTI